MTPAPRRDGHRTRDHISQTATALFLARGFEKVTVAEVAEASGVSKVTVFAHFARKEDLLLDRAPEAAQLMQDALQNRAIRVGPIEALRNLALELVDTQHPLSGLDPASLQFFRTVAASAALVTRTRELSAEIEKQLARLLADEPERVRDPRLLAALIIAAYRTLMVGSAERLLAGDPYDEIAEAHRRRLERSFDALVRAAGFLGGQDR